MFTRSMYGRIPEIKAIHAGLECGLIGGVYPGLDMISFGPTIRYPHSPDEKVHIESVEKFWVFLVETLKNIPVKTKLIFDNGDGYKTDIPEQKKTVL
jgi:dipeptidase D